jgi:hypothetical protein
MRTTLLSLLVACTDPNPYEPVACKITDHVTTCDAACVPDARYQQAGGACMADNFMCVSTVVWNGWRGCCDYDADLNILWHGCAP